MVRSILAEGCRLSDSVSSGLFKSHKLQPRLSDAATVLNEPVPVPVAFRLNSGQKCLHNLYADICSLYWTN